MILKGKVAVITGGTSGIGRATAKLFCREGACTVVVGRTPYKGEETINDIKKEGGEVFYFQADVSKNEDVKKMIHGTIERYGKIDILVNCAGIQLFYRPIEEIDENEWDDIMKINLKGTFLCSKHVVPFMKKQRYGVIINLGSTLGVVGQAGYSAYCASKGGVIQFTKALALELAPYGIRVNCVCPGTTVEVKPEGYFAYGRRLDRETVESRIRLHPIGRLGTPEDVANAILFLASDKSSFITGTLLLVDGGYTSW